MELTILRLSIYEMFHRDDVPPKVAINEAVELAKAFGDENSKKIYKWDIRRSCKDP